MKNIKNADELIRGISIILSKYRCSFSADELGLLKQCIETLEEGKKGSDPLRQLEVVVGVVSSITRIFFITEHLKDLF
jgi:hypothetical protein